MSSNHRIKLAVVLIGLLLVSAASVSQAKSKMDFNLDDSPWQVSVNTGYFTGDTLIKTVIGGETVKAQTDTGWLLGVSAGKDQQYWGWQVSLSGVFADMDLKADPAAVIPSANDATTYLAGADLLWYPTGGNWADGNIKPYFAAGTGLGLISSDFNDIDSETLYNFNTGAGVKFKLNDSGTFMKIDWRWYNARGFGSDMGHDMYHQSLTAGIGWTF